MPSSDSRFRPPLAAAAALVLAACSPTFNWREVPVADDGLVVLLPCKPDRANRALPLGVESVQVDMAGCETGGATFAVAHASADSPAQAEAWLKAWRAATRSQLGETQMTEAPAALKRALAAPAPVRLDAQPPRQGAAPVQVLWFAQSKKNGGVSLYQATVLGRPSAPDAATTFFEGLRLP